MLILNQLFATEEWIGIGIGPLGNPYAGYSVKASAQSESVCQKFCLNGDCSFHVILSHEGNIIVIFHP
jgi:hypothetical protein